MLNCGKVESFQENPRRWGYINGGFFVLSNKIFDHLKTDNLSWEGKPLLDLVELDELMAFRHEGFWCAMDTLREKIIFTHCGWKIKPHGKHGNMSK